MHVSSIITALLVYASVCLSQAVLKALPRGNAHDIAVGKATARTLSPTSHVQGKAFNCFMQIWLDNYDAENSTNGESWKWLSSRGTTLANYSAITHPSQPNYVASVGGDPYGVLADLSYTIPREYRTIVDLLEEKNITWSVYASLFLSPATKATITLTMQGSTSAYMTEDWIHLTNILSPLMSYQSITSKPDRLAMIKNFTLFHHDLEVNKLPQWIFIAPNMINSGHGSTDAGLKWAVGFLQPLLLDGHFMRDTLILLTFGQNKNIALPNNVPSFLFGVRKGPRPGKIDNGAYNHYSSIATVENNWKLGSLGQNDRSASMFSLTGLKDVE